MTVNTLVMSNYLEEKLIKHIFMNTPYTPPAHLYVALYTTNPGDVDTGTEVPFYGGYSRVVCPTFDMFTQNRMYTIPIIQFPLATQNWGTIGWFGLRDAATGGNLLFYGLITNPQTIYTGNILKISTGFYIGLYGRELYGGWGGEITLPILSFILNNGGTFTSPGLSLYMALGRDPLFDEEYNITWFTEVAGGGYTRKAIGGGSYWAHDTGGHIYTISNLVFTSSASADWGEITHCVFFNSSSAGDKIMWGKLNTPKTVLYGDGVIFPAGDINAYIY